MGGQNYGTFWIKKGCAPFCALFGQIMCDFELKTIGNSEHSSKFENENIEETESVIYKVSKIHFASRGFLHQVHIYIDLRPQTPWSLKKFCH